ncbi:MAG: hypothetical protein RLZZ502_1070, partial [Pseudomonadota bacterium]
TLGQASPTLSGGEAQRIKLVQELAKVRLEPVNVKPSQAKKVARSTPPTSLTHTLYVLDEPSVGLHMADVEKLIHVLHRLVDGGNSVLLIEHNLDLIAEADYLIDIGPEGGGRGGELVVAGTPKQVMKEKKSHTGAALKRFLTRK